MSDRHLLRVVVVCGLGVVLCFAALAFCGCASSRTGQALNVGVGVAGMADLVTTRQAIARGHREANPLLQTTAVGQGLLKLGGVGAVIGAAFLLDLKGHPVLAHVVRSVVIAVWSAAAIHNRSVR